MNHTPTEDAPTIKQQLRVYQINCNKSNTAQSDVINLSPKDWDIICIQEPYLDFQNLTRSTQSWNVVYPHTHSTARVSRSVMLISRALSLDSWQELPVASQDITAIQVYGGFGTLRIFNLYNACEHSETLHSLDEYLTRTAANPTRDTPIYDLWLGDFNRHDPMWEDPAHAHLFTRKHLDDADVLINLLAEYGMNLALPPGIPTLEHMRSKARHRVDQVFCTHEFTDSISRCDVLPDRPPRTDHFPVVTVIDLETARYVPTPKRNFREVDWQAFNNHLVDLLAKVQLRDPQSIEEFDSMWEDFEGAIQDTISLHVPMTSVCPYTKRWWSRELAQMRSNVKHLARSAHNLKHSPGHPVHEEHRIARNAYADAIKNAKREHWEQWIVDTEVMTMWVLNKYITAEPTDGGRARIPNLQVRQPDGSIKMATDNESKARAFLDVFFAPPPTTSYVPDYVYPKPKEPFKEITDAQIRRVISRLSPYKAPGTDGISNSVLTHCADALVPYLGKFFRATFRLKYYPTYFKDYNTVILRKPGKPDYSIPKASRPIGLCKTIPKTLVACVAEDISYMAEKHGLLPSRHFGGRPGRTTTDSLHLLIKWIKDSMRNGQVVAVLFLDISGAFPNVNIPMLIHNMRKRGVPQEYTDWLDRRLDGRTSTIQFDDYVSEPFPVTNGLEQGDTGSPLWFLFFNADLIEDSRYGSNELAAAFIDDTYLAARASSAEEATALLEDMMTRDGGALDWAKTHHAKFELDKNALMVFSNKRIPDPASPNKTIPAPRPSITIEGHLNKPVPHTKFLGVIIDQDLKFKQHTDYAVAKAMKWITQTRRASKVVKGIKGEYARHLYNGACIPRMLYGASVWLTPIVRVEGKRTKGSVGAATKLNRLQRMAAIQITGAMKTCANDVLVAHADLLPIDLLIDKWCQREALRIATLPSSHPLYRPAIAAAKRLPKRMPSPLHTIMHSYGLHPEEIEKVEAVRVSPKWQPKASIRIAPSKEDAIREEREDGAEVKVYSDGSGIDRHIGAAAVLFRNGSRRGTLRYKLGSDTLHTVYEGEVVGASLGTELLRTQKKVRSASIYIDNQACIRSYQLARPKPGHYLVDHLHKQLDRVFKKHPNIHLRLRWIPGHLGNDGNEAVDEEAKKAARGETSEDKTLPARFRSRRSIPASKSALKQAYQEQIKVRNKLSFSKSPRYAAMCRIDASLPSDKYRKLVRTLPRKHASILTQLRTGHAPLNKHLHRLKCAESPMCPNCEKEVETVAHYLILCPALECHRWELQSHLNQDAKSLAVLLNRPDAMKPLFRYIHRTGRFHEQFGDLETIPNSAAKKHGRERRGPKEGRQ